MENSKTTKRFTVERKPIRQARYLPAEIVELAKGHYFIDFGKAFFAGLELEFRKSEAGRKITVHMGERISAPTTVHRNPGGSVRYHTTVITLTAGQTTYIVPLPKQDNRLMPESIGAVMPFRYVELENAPALEEKNIRQVAALYDFDDNASDFKCSDEKLNAIWEMCKHTMKATSFGGVFVDGDRERLPYEADAYINQLGWYYSTEDLTLPRYSHEYLISNPTWPTEWIMFSVLMAWEDYRYTGDLSSVKYFYEDLKAKTLIALQRQDGLISTVEPPITKNQQEQVHYHNSAHNIHDIVDWPPFERDGYEMKPINTVVNAFYCRTLDLMANLAGAVSKGEDEKLFRTARLKALNCLNEKLFCRETGLYVDGEGSSHSSLHANMFPLAFDLVPKDRKAGVVEFLAGRGMACSVYAAQFLMEALFDNGKAGHALALMTAENDRSWTHMIERVGTTIALEAWDTKYKPNQDWNHAWGAAPANILPRKVIGVEPLEPGFKKILVKPCPGNLDWASGKFPTALGPICVKYERTAKIFKLTLDIPKGTTAKVCVPLIIERKVFLDGKAIAGFTDEGYIFIDPIAPGKHEIILQ